MARELCAVPCAGRLTARPAPSPTDASGAFPQGREALGRTSLVNGSTYPPLSSARLQAAGTRADLTRRPWRQDLVTAVERHVTTRRTIRPVVMSTRPRSATVRPAASLLLLATLPACGRARLTPVPPATPTPLGLLSASCRHQGAAPYDVELRRRAAPDPTGSRRDVGTLVVRVIALRSGAVLQARVRLQVGAAELVPVPDAATSGWWTFTDVPAGDHRLRVTAIGYNGVDGIVRSDGGTVDTLFTRLNGHAAVYGDLGCDRPGPGAPERR
jgi:hypothetical protein